MSAARVLFTCCLIMFSASAASVTECDGDARCAADKDAAVLLQSTIKLATATKCEPGSYSDSGEPCTPPDDGMNTEPAATADSTYADSTYNADSDSTYDVLTPGAPTTDADSGTDAEVWTDPVDPNNPASTSSDTESTLGDGAADPDDVNIFFGGACSESGSSVGSSDDLDSSSNSKFVPEFVKSKTCADVLTVNGVDETTCKECLDGDDCWKGLCTPLPNDGQSPAMQIVTLAGDSSSHIAEFWADCTSAKAEWIVQTLTASVEDLTIGTNDLEYNAIIKVISGSQVLNGVADVSGIYGTGSTRTAVSSEEGTKTRIWVVMNAEDPTKAARATVKIVAWDAEAEAEKCMGKKMCLRDLNGDGSAAGTAIRNSNTLQLECLKTGVLDDATIAGQCPKLACLKTTAGQSHCESLNAKCAAWISCLNDSNVAKNRLKSILEVSLTDQHGHVKTIAEDSICATSGSASLLLEKQDSGSGLSTSKEGGCVHPTTDDPESWECDCALALDKACLGSSDSQAVCYKHHMCEADQLCDSWKAEVGCPTGTGTVALEEKALQQRRQNMSSEQVISLHAEKDNAGSLDESLEGKRCA